jgi:hypothetical protein
MSFGELIEAATVALVASGLRWTPVVGLAAVVALSARRSSAAWRHAVWAGALLAGIVVVLGAGWLPRWELAALTSLGGTEAGAGVERVAVAATGAVSRLAGSLDGEVVPDLADLSSLPAGTGSAGAGLRWVGIVWLTGCLLLLAREVFGALSASRLVRACKEVDPALGALLSAATRSGDGPAHAVAVRVGPVAVPAVAGILEPRVLVPAAALRWPREWLVAALAHEAAHVERRDLGWLQLARLLRAVLWFHPAAWWLARRLAVEAELACDERAVGAGIDPIAYAGALVGIAGDGRRAALSTLAVVSRPSELRRRVVRLVGGRVTVSSGSSRWVAALLAASGLLLGGVELGGLELGSATTAALPLEGPRPSLPLREIEPTVWALGCDPADVTCAKMTEAALALLRREGVPGVALVQRVADGRVTGYAAVQPGPGPQPGLPWLAPGSLAKLPLAAAWWDAGLVSPGLPCEADRLPASGDSPAPSREVSVEEMVVYSCTSGATELGRLLVEARGVGAMAKALAPLLAPDALSPAGPDEVAFAATPGVDWPLQAAGIGPLATTPWTAARWLQAVASDATLAASEAAGAADGAGERLVSPATAQRLRNALREVVQNGTASGSARAGAGEGWRLAGKTGTVAGAGGALDGWFAGFVEGERDLPEHVVVVWLQGAGPGGRRPTRLAAALAGEIHR